MSVGTITVAVYCDGAYHEAKQLTFYDRVLKADILRKLREQGWTVTNSKTYCPAHPKRLSDKRGKDT